MANNSPRSPKRLPTLHRRPHLLPPHLTHPTPHKTTDTHPNTHPPPTNPPTAENQLRFNRRVVELYMAYGGQINLPGRCERFAFATGQLLMITAARRTHDVWGAAPAFCLKETDRRKFVGGGAKLIGAPRDFKWHVVENVFEKGNA